MSFFQQDMNMNFQSPKNQDGLKIPEPETAPPARALDILKTFIEMAQANPGEQEYVVEQDYINANEIAYIKWRMDGTKWVVSFREPTSEGMYNDYAVIFRPKEKPPWLKKPDYEGWGGNQGGNLWNDR